MNPAVVIVSVLFFTSAILCITMALAWLQFGRARHLATWSFAYGVGALQWVVNAYSVLIAPGQPAPRIVASVLVFVASSLFVVGARQRARLPVRAPVFIGCIAVLTAAIVMVYTVTPHIGLRGAITNLFAAAVLPFAILAVWPRTRKANPPERAFMGMLAILSIYQTILGFAGLAMGREGDIAGLGLYRAILGVGMPAIYVGTGIAAILLVAGDLAENLRTLVARDVLTGALNRRGLEQAATAAIANARRHDRAFSVVICDIDRFKAVNDRFGHAVGDNALIQFADAVQSAVREEDMLGRIGGDEFCLLLTDAGPDEAFEAIERIRRELADTPIPDAPGATLAASFGIASLGPEDAFFGEILRRADRALYDAKAGGRNRTVVAA